MADEKQTQQAAPVQYPSTGGRYVRQADGSVIPASEAAKAKRTTKTPKTNQRAGGDA